MAGRDFNPTPGEWEFVPGEPGFSGSREEPPEPSCPPTVCVTTETSEGVTFDFELAELKDPSYLAEPDPEDYHDTGERWCGDAESNGRLMAASKDLYDALEETLDAFESFQQEVNWKASPLSAETIQKTIEAPFKARQALVKARSRS